MRPQVDGSLPDAIRVVIEDLNATVVYLQQKNYLKPAIEELMNEWLKHLLTQERLRGLLVGTGVNL